MKCNVWSVVYLFIVLWKGWSVVKWAGLRRKWKLWLSYHWRRSVVGWLSSSASKSGPYDQWIKTAIRQHVREKNGLSDEIEELNYFSSELYHKLSEWTLDMLSSAAYFGSEYSVKETVRSALNSEFKLDSEAVRPSLKPAATPAI